ncbi:MAG TPA: GDP-L-fucose synthase [Candidatus Babeliales bacterium]|nr:GDP-L-fucose synthase [Candidatus Babeliales bacterium]HLC07492.1 GDP-L-fucose synthase [Candidatus Babeliales bacterium]
MAQIRFLYVCFFLFSSTMFSMMKDAKIYVAGHKGLVGSAIVRCLLSAGYTNIIGRTSSELDLRDQQAVRNFFDQEKPEYVFLAAAKVGGIHANNTYPAQFIYDNLAIQTNVIHESYKHGVKKLVFLGSSCIYPRECSQPIKEEYLLTSPLEKTNEAYAIAKIAGLKLCEYYNKQYGISFIAVMPTNLYGPNDNFDLESSHVIPALLVKIYNAYKNNSPYCEVWGTGNPLREFLHVDDLAQALLLLMNTYDGNNIVNIGSGKDLSIRELVTLIKNIIGYEGEIVWKSSQPDGTPRKLLNIDTLTNMGWQPQISLLDGLKETVSWCHTNGIFG